MLISCVHLSKKLKYDDARQRELRACLRSFLAERKLSMAAFARLCKIGEGSITRFVSCGGSFSDTIFIKVTAFLAKYAVCKPAYEPVFMQRVESNKGESDAAIQQNVIT